MRVIKQDDKNEIKLYLLGQLDEANEERLEVRLLTETGFAEEFDTIVDEITDEYVHGEIESDDRKRLEAYFLRARERKLKARFASALIEHASATRTKAAPVKGPTLFERLVAFFSPQSMAFKFASTAAVLVLAVGIAYVAFRGSGPQTFQAMELSISNSDRAEGPQSKSLQLAPDTDAVRLILNLPPETNQYQRYTVELVTRDGVKTPLEVTEQNARTVTAIAPVSLLKRGSYGIELTGIKADGTAEHLPGTFYFKVQ